MTTICTLSATDSPNGVLLEFVIAADLIPV